MRARNEQCEPRMSVAMTTTTIGHRFSIQNAGVHLRAVLVIRTVLCRTFWQKIVFLFSLNSCDARGCLDFTEK